MTEAQSAAAHVDRVLDANGSIKVHGMSHCTDGHAIDLVKLVAALTRKERKTVQALIKAFGG